MLMLNALRRAEFLLRSRDVLCKIIATTTCRVSSVAVRLAISGIANPILTELLTMQVLDSPWMAVSTQRPLGFKRVKQRMLELRNW